MDLLQQQSCLARKRLSLSRGRLITHYADVFWLLPIPLLLFVVAGMSIFNNILTALVLLSLLLLPLLVFLSKYSELSLREIATSLAKEQNHSLVKDVLKELGWRVKTDNKGFIEAYTNNSGFWTWSNQMISILITDNKIAFNSINNPDNYRTQAISWGQNTRNIKKFRKLFGHLAIRRIYQ